MILGVELVVPLLEHWYRLLARPWTERANVILGVEIVVFSRPWTERASVILEVKMVAVSTEHW